jgi:hypothetical protein
MNKKELIEKLAEFPDGMEVRVHPDSELMIEDGISCFGEIGEISERKYLLNVITDTYQSREDYIEYLIHEEYRLSVIKKYIKEAEKIHAIIIEAIE